MYNMQKTEACNKFEYSVCILLNQCVILSSVKARTKSQLRRIKIQFARNKKEIAEKS